VQVLRLYLKAGTTPADAIARLTDRVNAARNLGAEVPRHGMTPAADADYLIERRKRYIEWVEATETQLANLTNDSDIVLMPYTPAYWEIRQLTPYSPRPVAFIEGEIERQRQTLEDMRDDLQRRRERAVSAEGHITVLDTNVLLHHELPKAIDWGGLVGADRVRLVIPLRVIEELDSKKYSDSPRIRSKARDLIPKLRGFVGAAGRPAALRDGVTIEIYDEPGARNRPADGDTEILETARELERLSGEGVTIVTGDTGMQLRAETEGLRATTLDAYWRD
jgi:hypothetical protein